MSHADAHLTAMVRGYLPELRLTFDAMVALDALNARAIFAERLRCIEPLLGGFGETASIWSRRAIRC